MVLAGSNTQIARFGMFEADLQRRLLTRGGLRVKIQDQPFQILVLLLARPGEIVTREEIQQELWSADTFVAFDDGLNTAIKKLRGALDDPSSSPVYIETVPRRGYRFLAPVRWRESETAAAPPVNNQEETDSAADAATDRSDAVIAIRHRALRVRPLAAGVVALAMLSLMGLGLWKHSPVSRVLFGRSKAPSAKAIEEYKQARVFWRQRTSDSLAKASERYQRAIDLDPNYAEAYAGLANCYVVSSMLSSVAHELVFPKARQAAEIAMRLDDHLGEAHLAMAEVRLYADWDFAAAEREFKRALELDPNSAQTHQWYAEYLSLMGRYEEAIAEVEHAKQLDPLAIIIYHQAGQIRQAARQYEAAVDEYRHALQLQPGYGPTLNGIATAYRRMGRMEDSIKAGRESDSYWNPGGTMAAEGRKIDEAYARRGMRGYLEAWNDFQVHQVRNNNIYFLAWTYALLGRKDEALHALQTSFDRRESDFLGAQNDPELDSLRDDPRFQTLMARAGLPAHSSATPAQEKTN